MQDPAEYEDQLFAARSMFSILGRQ